MAGSLPLRARGAGKQSSDGARGTRTPDLLGAIQALSQLSYSPEQPPSGGGKGHGTGAGVPQPLLWRHRSPRGQVALESNVPL